MRQGCDGTTMQSLLKTVDRTGRCARSVGEVGSPALLGCTPTTVSIIFLDTPILTATAKPCMPEPRPVRILLTLLLLLLCQHLSPS